MDLLLALFVGLASTGYSVVDKLGVGLLNPIVYIAGLATGTALFLAPYVLLKRRQECREAWHTRKGQSAWIGLGSMGTYLLILWAFQMANVSYVVTVRELSIAIVAILSVAVLKEPMTLPKGVSTAVIMVGVVLVKMA